MDLFICDYSEGCHPSILEALTASNFEQTHGYGMDPHCERARALIRDACGAPEAGVHFLVGGTQTNTTVIASVLRPYQGVLCADTGHINCHETGAIEATGHKVLALPASDGKITAEQVKHTVLAHRTDGSREHTVQPGMVYISYPTEQGTLYSAQELNDLSNICHQLGLPLFVDGARLGYGLMSRQADLTLRDLARLADVFYIGGTKMGALFGEAVVITNPALDVDFRYFIKQNGGMLAKGRLLGIQYECLFSDNRYFELGKHADALAERVRDAFVSAGYPMYYNSPTNQQFPILPDHEYEILSLSCEGEFWTRIDESHSVYRFCTSWATTPEAVNRLELAVNALHQ